MRIPHPNCGKLLIIFCVSIETKKGEFLRSKSYRASGAALPPSPLCEYTIGIQRRRKLSAHLRDTPKSSRTHFLSASADFDGSRRVGATRVNTNFE